MPLLLGHRANTPRWIRSYLRCADGVEIDVTLHNGRLVASHILPDTRPRLLRERLARLLETIHLSGPYGLEDLVSLVPPESAILFDLKTARAAHQLAGFLEGLSRSSLVMVATRWHSLVGLLKTDGVRVLLSLDSRPARPVELVEAAGADGVSVRAEYIDEEFVEELHSHGYLVTAWTVNMSGEAARLQAYGVDVIVTEYPCELRALAGRCRKRMDWPSRWGARVLVQRPAMAEAVMPASHPLGPTYGARQAARGGA
ncbi:glycerophosphodiester phosphodiesterase [Hyperthermus butylicus]|uniref:Glycerophosphoryl diester phosphodiesterase, UgpQ n=1 Tax=Hyperthermus butylicus (strain DSM 5456 / JCM 9403 / PLM1-5) TaxID=415426 RepID=A2BJN3_HYPBU|nr:glycerophosphodiester phosphodiesterase [Hyperthermus butylicus]ABM80194.1 glycerophosphoryl diester phosphodiesterase, UgpQ [Hyperthermus butylicus DSM 5456]